MARVSGNTDGKRDERLYALGQAVAARRRELGLSQEALADASGVNRSHMGEVERGKRNVTTLNVLRLAEALNTTAAELFKKADL
ncbi:helix-turn-helix transcriptional regulator [Caulobacter sp.]|uniref:helix-turn-helix domain-containing protein n=1 Tax=Caulobacter sp. TaxID=78 RepID=UPI00161915E9